jgi:hypothetical protein
MRVGPSKNPLQPGSSRKLPEESKRRKESIGKNGDVKIQMQQVTENCKDKFEAATLLKKKEKIN